MLTSLSGRFLFLTVIFVMLAEVLIFVPSIARFREDFLESRLERAQIASLAVLADDMLSEELEAELLDNAGVFNVVLRRDSMRQLVLTSPIPGEVDITFDLREASAWDLMRDALYRLIAGEPAIIRVIGAPSRAKEPAPDCLVARIQSLRLPVFSNQSPRICSVRPMVSLRTGFTGYISAASMKLMPAACAISIWAWASSGGVWLP